ncbi:hypothetical protein MUDAN_BIHEEGNE_00648 [Lactiplantibacillus mudanjiangensis]|uniref:hypothetical protein n=1 Tax=Lactiplantibacillus mudanjiangensis TaxID=1296538 RepID=UPI001013E8DB|nr:hypothetical protein [Lactiplantibacillus mudanjiangensis]VDG18745.1 hypothetical protein MUDAN_BIHEEGNE_00648 [Lactiplantibacillus mudanjiangensis]VDG31473.1 hypothetical protein MUDAN_DOGOELCO_03317 [Lactiplantibacillus mudanjiangensis]
MAYNDTIAGELLAISKHNRYVPGQQNGNTLEFFNQEDVWDTANELIKDGKLNAHIKWIPWTDGKLVDIVWDP